MKSAEPRILQSSRFWIVKVGNVKVVHSLLQAGPGSGLVTMFMLRLMMDNRIFLELKVWPKTIRGWWLYHMENLRLLSTRYSVKLLKPWDHKSLASFCQWKLELRPWILHLDYLLIIVAFISQSSSQIGDYMISENLFTTLWKNPLSLYNWCLNSFDFG